MREKERRKMCIFVHCDDVHADDAEVAIAVAVVALAVYLQSHLYPSLSESQAFAASSPYVNTHTYIHTYIHFHISYVQLYVWFLVSVKSGVGLRVRYSVCRLVVRSFRESFSKIVCRFDSLYLAIWELSEWVQVVGCVFGSMRMPILFHACLFLCILFSFCVCCCL